jgi:hypothetical protein
VSASDFDARIDELYQLPPEQFTAARNELAKQAPADRKPAVRALKKPSAPAWAVNQLYWKSRPEWDALIDAAEQLRDAHRSALEGRGGDLRKADAAHREALANAVKAAMAHVSAAGHQPTSALKDAVVRTLQALPADIEPGRLEAPLESAGFGLLEGIAPRGAVPPRPSAAPKPAPPAPRLADLDPKARKAREAEARRAKAEAEKARQLARREAERERREEERRAQAAVRRRAQLLAVVERAREKEAELRERLEQATRERVAAEKDLERAT